MVNGYCLDTNILIEVLRGDKKLKDKVDAMNSRSESFFFTPITLCELYKGAFLHSKKEEKLKQVEDLVDSFELIDFNSASCKMFGEIYTSLQKMGSMVPESDLMIASIVKTHDLLLITRDKKHFDNTGVKIEVW